MTVGRLRENVVMTITKLGLEEIKRRKPNATPEEIEQAVHDLHMRMPNDRI